MIEFIMQMSKTDDLYANKEADNVYYDNHTRTSGLRLDIGPDV